MRKSRYTFSCLGDAGEHLLYNTANGAFASLDDDAFKQYESCEGPLCGAMGEDGFLTDLTADEELTVQQALFDAAREDNSELVLSVAPTYACNLRCPYCYEQGHNGIPGKMEPKVQDAILEFAKERHRALGFSKLSIQWYGGDPSLALDVVEGLSRKFISWCNEAGVSYDAMMLTNCNLIDGPAVEMLSAMKVSSVLVTIDGFEETHNARRKSAVGLNSFERNIEAVKLFVAHGIEVKAVMNVDRVNWPEYRPLRDWLREKTGVELSCGRLCDYGHFFGTRDFKSPEFDLFEHDEFCRLTHEEFSSGNFDSETMRDLLRSVPRFCNGQRNAYYVIDTVGDVYACNGCIGERNHVIFNVLDAPEEEQLSAISHNPYESGHCRACHLLPICQGNCDWERKATGMICHPLLTTLDDYLRDYRSCFGATEGSYARLA